MSKWEHIPEYRLHRANHIVVEVAKALRLMGCDKASDELWEVSRLLDMGVK